ncbi:MAG: type II toxin-antitoxin system RelE/ParE family toxin [Nitrococcus sp.]|nr:type II toxin-antitoxin system RelE/ParE family toxin [Nitrococcus sp.]MDN5872391.1 type II toxin-antitoxin system RelE/ParE family toxin [Nitrococcus sp.]
MRLTYSDAFGRQLKRLRKKYRHIRDDLQPLIDDLQAGHTPGEQTTGAGYTVYKVRLANTDTGRGKSGGYRVIYWLQTAEARLLLTIYSKSEQTDLSAGQIKRIIDDEFDGE